MRFQKTNRFEVRLIVAMRRAFDFVPSDFGNTRASVLARRYPTL